MPVKIDCPSCTRQLRLPDELIGTSVRCPSCEHTFTAEAPNDPAAISAPPNAEDKGIQTAAPERRRGADADEDEDHPRPRSRPIDGRDYAPHRGGLWLGLGIGGLVCLLPGICIQPFVFGCIALGFSVTTLIMGGRDLKRIRAGEMDPTGEGLTRAGWILGIIGTVLGGMMVLCGGAVLVIFIVMIATGNLK